MIAKISQINRSQINRVLLFNSNCFLCSYYTCRKYVPVVLKLCNLLFFFLYLLTQVVQDLAQCCMTFRKKAVIEKYHWLYSSGCHICCSQGCTSTQQYQVGYMEAVLDIKVLAHQSQVHFLVKSTLGLHTKKRNSFFHKNH